MPIIEGLYKAPTWKNGSEPALDETELQAISDTLAAHDERFENVPVFKRVTHTQIFTDTVSDWEVPTAIDGKFLLTMFGGGGSGGDKTSVSTGLSVSAYAGGGGGGAGYRYFGLVTVQPGEHITVTVGKGGSGGNGGMTSFGTYASVSGGASGNGQNGGDGSSGGGGGGGLYVNNTSWSDPKNSPGGSGGNGEYGDGGAGGSYGGSSPANGGAGVDTTQTDEYFTGSGAAGTCSAVQATYSATNLSVRVQPGGGGGGGYGGIGGNGGDGIRISDSFIYLFAGSGGGGGGYGATPAASNGKGSGYGAGGAGAGGLSGTDKVSDMSGRGGICIVQWETWEAA